MERNVEVKKRIDMPGLANDEGIGVTRHDAQRIRIVYYAGPDTRYQKVGCGGLTVVGKPLFAKRESNSAPWRNR